MATKDELQLQLDEANERIEELEKDVERLEDEIDSLENELDEKYEEGHDDGYAKGIEEATRAVENLA